MVEVKGEAVYWNGVLVARLEPGSRRPALARDNWRVVDLAGKPLGFVKRGPFRLRWAVGSSPAVHHTREKAIEALLLRRRRETQ